MPEVTPSVILRMGTHAEKDYLEKTLRFYDGLAIGANLLEATPGATASLLVRFCGKKLGLPYYIDPMTYTYGSYRDDARHLRDDLDWIKSDQKRGGKQVRDFKRSYRALGSAFGGPYEKALKHSHAISRDDFSGKDGLPETCRSIANYQMRRIADELAADPELAIFADKIPKPAAVFSPYFYIEPSQAEDWLTLNLKLAEATAGLGLDLPVHATICVDADFLGNDAFLSALRSALPSTGVDGVWFWFSAFREDAAGVPELKAFRSLIEDLSTSMSVYNRHGGYFSLALSRYGLSGMSHGVGYGEQKDVLPVIGQSTPTVRYYLPAVHKRFGVPNIERCFDALGIHTPDDFYAKICDCVICKGVVSDNIHQFSAFGEMHRSRPTAKRLAQTPAAAKRCRFHFLLCRIRERDWMKSASVEDICRALIEAEAIWKKQPTLSSEVGHLSAWVEALN